MLATGCADIAFQQSDSSDAVSQKTVSLTSAAPPVEGELQSSVLIYMKSTTVKKYGFLAHMVGYRDSTDSITTYDPQKDWWECPALLYMEAGIPNPDTVGGADCEEMKGIGSSSNVDVTVDLTCHADVAFRSMPRADCVKATIIAKATAWAGFFDTRWTDVVTVKDKPFVFEIDTCDNSRRITPIGTERRTIHVSFEAYTRGRTRWTLRSQWPETPERADVRAVLYARDAQLIITGYRYDDAPPTSLQE